MTCKACGQPFGCDHSDAEYQGAVPRAVPMSAADQRGLDWFTRWVALGCNITSDDQGRLKLIPPSSCSSPDTARQILEMRQAIQGDALLAHAVGRVLLDYWRWEDAQEAKGNA